MQREAFGQVASCQILCTGKPCMDNAPKSITYITWIGRSAAELLVKPHWDSVDLCSGKKFYCFPGWPQGTAPGGAGATCSSVVSICMCFISIWIFLISPCTETDRFVGIKCVLRAGCSGVSKEELPCNSTRDLPPCLAPSLSRENLFHWTAVTVMM